MKIKPLSDYCVVKLAEREAVSPGGIHIPDRDSREAVALRGEVLAVGPGRRFMPEDDPLDEPFRVLTPPAALRMAVVVGDVVLFMRSYASEVRIGGESYMLVREREMLAVVEP